MAELREHARNLNDRLADGRGNDTAAAGDTGPHADRQWAVRPLTDHLAVPFGRLRSPYGSPDIGPATASSAAAVSRTERVTTNSHTRPPENVAVQWTERNPTTRRLEADKTTVGSRSTNRTATVIGVSYRHHARRHRRRRSAARPTRRPAEVPWIAGRPTQHRLRGGYQAEFRRICLARWQQAGGDEASVQLLILARDVTHATQVAHALVERNTSDFAHQILDQERHATERSRNPRSRLAAAWSNIGAITVFRSRFSASTRFNDASRTSSTDTEPAAISPATSVASNH